MQMVSPMNIINLHASTIRLILRFRRALIDMALTCIARPFCFYPVNGLLTLCIPPTLNLFNLTLLKFEEEEKEEKISIFFINIQISYRDDAMHFHTKTVSLSLKDKSIILNHFIYYTTGIAFKFLETSKKKKLRSIDIV